MSVEKSREGACFVLPNNQNVLLTNKVVLGSACRSKIKFKLLNFFEAIVSSCCLGLLWIPL